ncbi:MAG: restriction endonuclease subunit S [Candidatus Woesearchaeota archaeon]
MNPQTQNKPKFKQTEIGMIPEDWEVKSISETCDISLGGTPKTEIKYFWDGKFKWATARDIANVKSRYVTVTERTITEEGVKNSNAKIHPKNTIVITSRGTVGAIALLPEPMTFNQTCYGLQPKKEYDVIYLYYSIKNSINKIRSVSYGTVFETITTNTFKDVELPIPPLPEQRAIAKVLSAFDDKIELNQRMNKTLEAIGQAIFKHWFVDFEFPNEEGKPYKSSGGEMVYNEELGKEIPKGWRVGKIEDISSDEKNSIVDGPFGTQMKITEYQNSGIPIIEMEYLEGYPLYKPFKHFISEKKFQEVKRSSVKKGDIIISKTGTLGLLGIMTDIYDKAVIVSRLAKITIDENKIGRFYLFIFLKRLSEEKYWERISSGSTMPIINLNHIKSTKILIPEKKVLDIFENILTIIYNRIYNNLKESLTFSQLRDSLLPKLMSGKIRVPAEMIKEMEREIKKSA